MSEVILDEIGGQINSWATADALTPDTSHALYWWVWVVEDAGSNVATLYRCQTEEGAIALAASFAPLRVGRSLWRQTYRNVCRGLGVHRLTAGEVR